MRRPQNGWLAGSHFSEFMHDPGLLACIQGCHHACEWDLLSDSQPASQGPGAARYDQESENAMAARRAHALPGARAHEAVAADILWPARARARVSRSKFRKIRAPHCHFAEKMGDRPVSSYV